MKAKAILVMFFFTVLFAFPALTLAKSEVIWWHAMGGFLGEMVNELVQKFNASQSEYKLTAINKGSYPEALTAAIAAYRAKTHPHIIQVQEIATQTMLSSDAIYPVYKLMADQGININWADFINLIKSYYSYKGNLYSMPFNSSTAILYYNKSIFQKAGLQTEKPPATFDDIERCARAVVASRATKIGFTVSWPSWTLMENMHAWHDQPFANDDNGFAGLATQLKIINPFAERLMDLLTRWQGERIFTYSGRLAKGDQPIINGEAAIAIGSSALVGALSRRVKFEWGTGSLPRLSGFPQGNSIIGGGSLFVMKDHKTEEYRGVAKFLEFLVQKPQQAWWHAQTGYLPISNSVLKDLEASAHFKRNPEMWTAVAQISSGKVTSNSQGIRLGNFIAIRDAIEGEMENILARKKTPRQGLEDAVKAGNAILSEFAAMYR